MERRRRSSTAAAGCTGTSRTPGRRSRARACASSSATTPRSRAWYVGERAPRRHDRRARRDRPARLGPLRRRRRARRFRSRTIRCSRSTRSTRFDRLTIAERIDEIELDDEERDVLGAELESLAHGPLDDAGAVSVLRWHALSGLQPRAHAVHGRARHAGRRHRRAAARRSPTAPPFETRLETPVAAIAQTRRRRRGSRRARARCSRAARGVVAVPLNTLRRDRVRARALRGQAGRRSRSDRPRAGSRSSSAPAASRVRRTRSGPATRSATSTPRSCSTTARR